MDKGKIIIEWSRDFSGKFSYTHEGLTISENEMQCLRQVANNIQDIIKGADSLKKSNDGLYELITIETPSEHISFATEFFKKKGFEIVKQSGDYIFNFFSDKSKMRFKMKRLL